MMKAILTSIAVTLLLTVTRSAATGESPSAKPASAAFERLKSLVGTWKGVADMGQGPVEMTTQYHLIAGGSVITKTLIGLAAIIVLFLILATMDFTFQPAGDQTVVTWAMYGKNEFMGKLVGLFMDCETMCGPQFERGLADLAKVVAADSSVEPLRM